MKPDSSACILYLPGGTLTSRYSPFSLVTAQLAAPGEVGRRHGHARKHRLRFVGDRASDGNILRVSGRGVTDGDHRDDEHAE